MRRIDASAVESRVVRSSPHRVTAGACPDLAAPPACDGGYVAPRGAADHTVADVTKPSCGSRDKVSPLVPKPGRCAAVPGFQWHATAGR